MDITEGRIKRLRNLPAFKGKTDEELIEHIKRMSPKARKPRRTKEQMRGIPEPEHSQLPKDYDKRYNEKLNQLKVEFGIDMNDANDAENIRILVRLLIQLEDVDSRITTAAGEKFLDTKSFKELGEFQKSLVNGITDIQDKLGITRKVRKERQVDDIPQYLKEIRRKAREFWNRTTTSVMCEKCQIELARYWLNFPDLATKAAFELECWKCGEKVVHIK